MTSRDVGELFLELERLDYLEDRREYDFMMFLGAYPSLTISEVVDLFILVYLYNDDGGSAAEVLKRYNL